MSVYAFERDLKAWIGFSDTKDAVELQEALDAAERRIDTAAGWGTGRFLPLGSTQAQTVKADDPVDLRLRGGFHTATGLVVQTDDDDDGTFETTWTIGTDFELWPPPVDEDDLTAGADWGGVEGFPYCGLTAVNGKRWPTTGRRRRVKITRDPGWSALPDPVHTAVLIQAAYLHQRRRSTAGFVADEFGSGLRKASLRLDADAADMIAPYTHPSKRRGLA